MKRILVAAAALSGLLVAVAYIVPGAVLVYRGEAVIALPIAESWGKLQDLSLAHKYVPGIIDTEITNVTPERVGSSRRVYSTQRDYINETVTQWREGEGFTLSLHDDEGAAPVPFSQATFTYHLEAASESSTALSTELRFLLRGGLVGEWLGRAVLSGTFQESVDGVTAAMRDYYESGEDISGAAQGAGI